MSVHPRVTSPTWSFVSGLYLQQIAIDSTNQFQVAIQYVENGDNIVVYSRDFGATWTPSIGITGSANCISSTGQNVIVGVGSIASYLYSSTDFGTTFIPLTGSPQSSWTVVGLSRYSSSYMIACDYINDTATIYYSSDSGNTWSTLSSYSNTRIQQGAWSNIDSMNSMYFLGYSSVFPYYSELFISNNNG